MGGIPAGDEGDVPEGGVMGGAVGGDAGAAYGNAARRGATCGSGASRGATRRSGGAGTSSMLGSGVDVGMGGTVALKGNTVSSKYTWRETMTRLVSRL